MSEQEFPFEEIRKDSGDFFDSIEEAKAAGFEESQIWSVTECEDTFTYGPSRHWVNLLGYVATVEHHDDNTYFFEEPLMAFSAEGDEDV